MEALIFDLDNCLCAARAVGESCFAPAFAAIRAATPSGFDLRILRRVERDCWTHDFESVCSKHGLTPAMRQAGYEAFSAVEVRTRIAGYGDLPLLPSLPGRKFLVTSGFSRLQQSKVRALGLANAFERVFVDAIDLPPRQGKLRIFESILAAGPWAPPDVWVVGDNPESELAAGRALGCTTVQMVRPGVAIDAQARHHVRGLRALRALLAQRCAVGERDRPAPSPNIGTSRVAC